MKNQSKKIVIVIAVKNGRHYLPECLASIKSQSYPTSRIKVILIDNDSSDSSAQYIKDNYPEFKLIVNTKNTGFTHPNNQGYFLAQKSAADYLFLLNQDTIMEENCLARLVDLAEDDKKTAAVQPKLLLHPQKHLINSFGNSIQFLGFAYCNHYRQPDNIKNTEPVELPYASGAALLLKMPALERTGLFDDSLFAYHEDVDLGWNLRLLGYRLMLDPLAVVWHKYAFSKAKYKYYYLERNRLKVILQNYKFATLFVFLPALLIMEIGILAYSAKGGWLVEKLKGYLWLIWHLPAILWRRYNIQMRLRKVKDREILKLFVGGIKSEELKNPLLLYAVNPLMALYFWLAKKIIFW